MPPLFSLLTVVDREECAGVIPLRKNDRGEYEVLLVRHVRGNYLSFPKGHIDPGESSQETARRELFEETRLVPEKWFEGLLFREDYVVERPEGPVRKYVTYYAAVVTGEASLTDEREISEVRWFSFPEAREALTYPDSRRILSELQKALLSFS